MKKRSKERIDRLFDNGYGIIRIKKIALVKEYNYKYLIKRLFLNIIEIPMDFINDIFRVIIWLFKFIPKIYIENDEEIN